MSEFPFLSFSGFAQGPLASEMLESESIQGSEATAKHRSHDPLARSRLEAAGLSVPRYPRPQQRST